MSFIFMRSHLLFSHCFLRPINCHLCCKIFFPLLFWFAFILISFYSVENVYRFYFHVCCVAVSGLCRGICSSILLPVPVLHCCKQCFCEHPCELCLCAHGHIGLSVRVQKWNRQDSEWHCIYVLIVARVVSAVSAWSCRVPKYFLGLRSFKVDFWGFSKLPIISSANVQFRV